MIKIVTTLLFIIFIFSSNLSANTLAFGYLKNETNNKAFNFLQVIFPNSFASTLKSSYKGTILKPSTINNILKKEGLKLKYSYSNKELPKLLKIINADYFIYGSFLPQQNENIKITIHMYISKTKELFTFVDTGKMETEIFKLVDRIAIIFKNLANENLYYKNKRIIKNTNLAFITNISRQHLNEFYFPFFKKNFSISYVQNSDLNTHYNDIQFNSFTQIFTSPVGLKNVEDEKDLEFQYGTWNNSKQIKLINKTINTLKLYYYDFPETKNKALTNLANAYNNNIDYLFLIKFNKSHNKILLRCIDMRSKLVIWYQSNIDASGKTDSNYQNIASNIIKQFPKLSSKKYKTKN